MRMTIEKALEWAYREELPREQVEVQSLVAEALGSIGLADASGPMQRHLANPSAAIDAPLNRWGIVGVRFLFERGPHADAIQIGAAVEALCAEAVTMTLTEPLPGIASPECPLWQEALEKAARRLPRRLRDVIIRRALAGDPKHWEEDAIATVPEKDPYGNPRWFRTVVQDLGGGQTERVERIVDKKERRRHADCYQKFKLSPDPVWAIEARAVHLAWCAALDVLYEDLAGRMTRLRLEPRAAALEPWKEGAPVPEKKVRAWA